MDKTDKNTIEELLPRYCEGLATEEERLQVETWMDESEENRRMAKQIHALYLATDTVHIMTKVDTEKALTKVKSRMTGNRQRKTTWWEWAQRAAAVLFIPLLVTLMVQHWGGSEQELAQMMEVKTNPGMMTSLTLPDGTLVFLNSESTLSYPVCTPLTSLMVCNCSLTVRSAISLNSSSDRLSLWIVTIRIGEASASALVTVGGSQSRGR